MSTIVTDTLQGKTSATSITLPTTTNIGSTPLVSASANSMTIRGEGSAVTNIQQGLCKAWIRFNGESTIAINDSFNMTSITDNDAGYYTTTYTNPFNTQYNSITICSDRDSNNHRLTHHFLESATTQNLIYMVNKDNSNADADKIAESIHGDLA